MEYAGEEEEKIVEDESGKGDGWVETFHNNEDADDVVDDNSNEMTLENINDESNSVKECDDQNDEDDDEETVDMEEFEESGMLDLVDPSTAIIAQQVDNLKIGNEDKSEKDSVIHTRTYDLHITYDKYYQTPRLWVIGYDEVSSSSVLIFYFITEEIYEHKPLTGYLEIYKK